MTWHPSLRAVSLTVAAAAFTAACTNAGAPTGPKDDIRAFYQQKLTFGTCDGYGSTLEEKASFVAPLECARLKVPLNYDDPDGTTMQVAVIRLPAQGAPQKRIGSLVLNPGGGVLDAEGRRGHRGSAAAAVQHVRQALGRAVRAGVGRAGR